jgi:hypothetical protein
MFSWTRRRTICRHLLIAWYSYLLIVCLPPLRAVCRISVGCVLCAVVCVGCPGYRVMCGVLGL